MKQEQNNTQPQAALLRSASRVDAPVKTVSLRSSRHYCSSQQHHRGAYTPRKAARGSAR